MWHCFASSIRPSKRILISLESISEEPLSKTYVRYVIPSPMTFTCAVGFQWLVSIARIFPSASSVSGIKALTAHPSIVSRHPYLLNSRLWITVLLSRSASASFVNSTQ